MVSPNRMSPLQETINDIFQGLGLVFLVAVFALALWLLSSDQFTVLTLPFK